MRVLDLFSGTGGWSEAFRQRDHHVYRIDNNERFALVPDTTIEDVLDIDWGTLGWYDVILASPPCQAFSLGAGGTHVAAFGFCVECGMDARKVHEKFICEQCGLTKVRFEKLLPVSEFGELSIRLVERTLELVERMQPSFWWMENPNGGMIHFVPDSIPRVKVTYCQYGESRMKLTNLWGRWPGSWLQSTGKDRLWTNKASYGWHPRPRCKNGDSCHEAARRGAKTGTQRLKNSVDRAIVPYELSLEVCIAVEEALT